ncbi:alpha/beta fold hydrolase [Stappia sp.]|uniref:alpha/beta fold hydrolase n=1 Tax=Stappia sp. TaxID=1870903 RepID=UPI003D0C3960
MTDERGDTAPDDEAGAGPARPLRETLPHKETWRSNDGLELAATVWPPSSSRTRKPDVLCLAGLSRNARDFEALAEALSARGHRVVAMDYRGRGHSGRHPDWRTYSIEREAADIDAGLEALELSRAVVVGTSRGGLHGMLLAWRAPARVAGLVLNDIGPAIERAGLQRLSGAIGRRMAARDWSDATDLLKASLGGQFPTLDDAGWRRFAGQLYSEAAEGLLLDYDARLANTLSEIDEDTETPDFWPVFEAIGAIPLLAIRGALSDILSAETFAAMGARHPDARLHLVADEGHAPLLWDAATQEAIAAFASNLR